MEESRGDAEKQLPKGDEHQDPRHGTSPKGTLKDGFRHQSGGWDSTKSCWDREVEKQSGVGGSKEEKSRWGHHPEMQKNREMSGLGQEEQTDQTDKVRLR
jgi:hypothetical protein